MPKTSYIDKWLNRLRKEMAVSGRLTQLSLYLAKNSSQSSAEWQTSIRNIINGDTKANTDFVLAVDRWNSLNKKPSPSGTESDSQMDLL